MVPMDLVAVIRHKVHAEGVPIREVARELGLSRNTIRRYARAKRVPIDRSSLPARSTPARDAIEEAAASIWQSRRSFTAGKQRLTAARLWELLRDAGHAASERTVRRLVAEFRSAEREVTVPLVYGCGEVAQVDFFEVWVELAGVRQKSWLFLMRLMHSGRDFAMLCAQQDTTWFLAAHVAAFTHFAGVVAAIAYDNLTAAVGKVLVGAPRVLRPRFAALAAHYAFEPRFCRPGEGHDKGGVERRGGHIRWQHLVPLPQGASLAAMSAVLQKRLDAQHGRDASRAEAWARERAALRALPEPFDGRHVRVVKLRHHATTAIAGGVYSVPSRWCGQAIDVFVGIDTVTFALGDETVSHARVAFGGRRIDYRHLLAPLSIKPQALRQVAAELVAQFGEPWPSLWAALRSLHSPDEIEAARRLGPWLERADREGVGRPLARAIEAAVADGSLVTTPRRPAARDAPTLVPQALQKYAVEGPDLRRYDALLDRVSA
ncbi:MAG TPA: IS21 family transposase [Polyangiaceae bacterium]|nr:IS21 family transposase [Polyangiaceae bacterium]